MSFAIAHRAISALGFRRVVTLIGLVAALGVPRVKPVFAQSSRSQSPGTELSLAMALSRALRSNPELRLARADTGFALAQLIGSRLRPNPSVSAQYQTTGDRNSSGLEAEASISFTQELSLWGIRPNRIRAAGFEQQRALYASLDAERQVRREVAASYRELLFDRERAALLDSLATLNSRISRAAQLAFQQGLGSEIDARVTVAAWQQAALDRERALREYDIEQLQLARLLGDTLRSTYRLTDSLPTAGLRFLTAVRTSGSATTPAATSEGVRVDLVDTGVDSLVRVALAARPDVRAAEYDIQSNVASLAAARGGSKPTVSVGGLFSTARDNFSLAGVQGSNLDRSLGIGVVLGLPLRNKNQGEIARAEFATAAAQLRLASARQLVERDVRVAAGQLALAATQVETLRRLILPANTTALRIVEAAFGRGQVNIFQVLQVQRAYVESSTGLVEALRQYVAALVDLEAAVGQPIQ